jgi:hypothetical protein
MSGEYKSGEHNGVQNGEVIFIASLLQLQMQDKHARPTLDPRESRALPTWVPHPFRHIIPISAPF